MPCACKLWPAPVQANSGAGAPVVHSAKPQTRPPHSARSCGARPRLLQHRPDARLLELDKCCCRDRQSARGRGPSLIKTATKNTFIDADQIIQICSCHAYSPATTLVKMRTLQCRAQARTGRDLSFRNAPGETASVVKPCAYRAGGARMAYRRRSRLRRQRDRAC